MVSTLHVRLIEIYLPAKFQSSSSKKNFARASGFSGFWPHFDDVITGHVIFQKFSYCFNGPFKSLTTTWKKNHFSISSQKKVFWCENFLVSTRTDGRTDTQNFCYCINRLQLFLTKWYLNKFSNLNTIRIWFSTRPL